MSVLRAIAEIITGLVYLARLIHENRNEAWVQGVRRFSSDLLTLDTPEKRHEAAVKLNQLFRDA
jgi:hypothetical protein